MLFSKKLKLKNLVIYTYITLINVNINIYVYALYQYKISIEITFLKHTLSIYEIYLSFISIILMRADMRKAICDKSDSFAIPAQGNEFQRSVSSFIKLRIIYSIML